MPPPHLNSAYLGPLTARPAPRHAAPQVRQHPWFLINLPRELQSPTFAQAHPEPHQSPEEIARIVAQARTLGGNEALMGAGKDAAMAEPISAEDYVDEVLGAGSGDYYAAV